MQDAIWHIDNRDITVTHLDKVFWPEKSVTKGDMLTYYKEMAAMLLPYFHHRPVTMKMFPDGITNISFYIRDYPTYAPSWIPSFTYQPKTVNHKVKLPLIDNGASLLWFANHAAIEFHIWQSTTNAIHHPDMVVFDLDAGNQVPFPHVCEAAILIKEKLAKDNLLSYAKTTGGRGMHIYIPIKQQYTFEQVRTWTACIADDLAKANKSLFTHTKGSTHEKHLISIDYAQNSIGKNTAIPYTLRATNDATVSTPLTWDEIAKATITPEDFTMHTIQKRVKKRGDIFLPVLAHNQTLPIA